MVCLGHSIQNRKEADRKYGISKEAQEVEKKAYKLCSDNFEKKVKVEERTRQQEMHRLWKSDKVVMSHTIL